MSYLDKYKGCKGCPVHAYCGTMISSRRLCNSDTSDNKQKVKQQKKLKHNETRHYISSWW